MKRISIVTDSSSDIPTALAEKYGIEIVPMYIGVEGNMKRDLYEITPEEVFNAMEKNKKIHTSSPSAGDYIKVFKKLTEEKKSEVVFCITLSKNLSAAFNAAKVAAGLLPGENIRVIDSRTSTICMGFMVLQAAMAIEKGLQPEEIEKLIYTLVEKNRFIAVLDSFEYVFKGGRGAFFGKILKTMLRFKPVLTIGRNGKVHLTKFVKNSENAIIEIYNQTVSHINKNNLSKIPVKLGIFYGIDSGQTKMLEKLFKENDKFLIDEIITTKITTVISAHTGPGLWGIAISPLLI